MFAAIALYGLAFVLQVSFAIMVTNLTQSVVESLEGGGGICCRKTEVNIYRAGIPGAPIDDTQSEDLWEEQKKKEKIKEQLYAQREHELTEKESQKFDFEQPLVTRKSKPTVKKGIVSKREYPPELQQQPQEQHSKDAGVGIELKKID